MVFSFKILSTVLDRVSRFHSGGRKMKSMWKFADEALLVVFL